MNQDTGETSELNPQAFLHFSVSSTPRDKPFFVSPTSIIRKLKNVWGKQTENTHG